MANRQLSFMTACDIGDSLITIDEFGIGMFRIDKNDMSSHLIAELEDRGKWPNRYRAAELCDNEIFFFPALISIEYKVIVYHLDSRKVEYLDLRSISDDIVGDYEPLYRLGNCIWMFPRELTRDLIRFQLDTRKITVIPQWKNAVKNINLDYTDPWAKTGDPVEVQNVLYQMIRGTNRMLEIDKKNCNVECHTIPVDAKLYIRMDYDGEKFWIAECNDKGVVSWDPVTQKAQRYSIVFPKEEKKQYDWIGHILCGARYLWLIPQRDKTIIRMNYESGEYEYISIFPSKFQVRKGNNQVFGLIEKNGDIADLYPFFGNLIIHLDLKNDILLENYEQIMLPCEWSESDIYHYQMRHEYETERVPFDAYIDFLSQTVHQKKNKEGNGTIGEDIWRQIRA